MAAQEQPAPPRSVQLVMSGAEAEALWQWLTSLGQLPPVAIALLSALTEVVAAKALDAEVPMV